MPSSFEAALVEKPQHGFFLSIHVEHYLNIQKVLCLMEWIVMDFKYLY